MRRAIHLLRLIALIVVGVLSGLYAVGSAAFLIQALFTHGLATSSGISMVAAHVAPPCIGLIICLACFKRVFHKSPAISTALAN
jgi:hypothetical protein